MQNAETQNTELLDSQILVEEKEESQLRASQHSRYCLTAPVDKDSCLKSMPHSSASVRYLRQSYLRLL